MNFSVGRYVVKQDIISVTESFMQGFAPESWFIGEIWASIFRQGTTQRAGVHASESQSNNSTPVVGDFGKLHTNSLVDFDWTSTESDSFAEAFISSSDLSIAGDANVVTVHTVESQWR